MTQRMRDKLWMIAVFVVGVLGTMLVMERAHATPPDKGPQKVIINKDNIYDRSSEANAEANARSESNAFSSALAQSENENHNQSSAIVNFTAPDDIDIDRTVAVGRGSLYPSAPCMGVVDGGLSITGASLSAGKSYVDEVCQKLEWARMAYQVGLRDAAVYAICNMPQAGEDNPGCTASNDYHRQMAMLKVDNEEFQRNYSHMQNTIRSLQQERENLREALREARMKEAVNAK